MKVVIKINKILGLFTMLFFVGCNLNTTTHNSRYDKIEAERNTNAFYRGVLTSDYSKVDTLFSPMHYNKQKRDSLGIFIKNIHDQFGTIVTWNLIDWQTVDVKGTDDKTDYALVYSVKFSKKEITETFIMRKEDGKIKIIDLQISE
jgi:hypothetical protein